MKTREELKQLTHGEQVEYYCYLNDVICVSNGNSKTGRGIYTLSFPVETTCRIDAPCRKYCYACKGKQQCPTVKGAYYRNYRIYTENPARFWEQLKTMILLYDIRVLRLCDCGDIPDADFLTGINEIAKAYPDLTIYGYTKKYEMFNEWHNAHEIANNFKMWFSAWDKTWAIDNPYNMPVSYVDFTNKANNPEIPEKAFKCAGASVTCTLCKACFNGKNNAVVFHQH